ncbi:hypothetical protein Pcinc_021985 [Petrolisthes cinctipes]|uniref:Uncharacterized protein n=1 Tax=Petrolisthes cinctipes TaxID=88211 RepID=A0AAE1KEB3_PETCI|nr:hypothetical protein Pcinc_021985 [Petrolisthes cinctipes]
MWKVLACVAWMVVVAAASTLTLTHQTQGPHNTHLLTPLKDTPEGNEYLRDLKESSHRYRRSLYGTGLGISVLAVISFAFFLKYFLYFIISEYKNEEGGERSLRDDLFNYSWFLACLGNEGSVFEDEENSNGYKKLERLYNCLTTNDEVGNTINAEPIPGLMGWDGADVNSHKDKEHSGGSSEFPTFPVH